MPPLDNAEFISQLSRTIPDDATSPFYWAESMRTIKQVIKNTFPNWLYDTGITDFQKLKTNFNNIKAYNDGILTGVYFVSEQYKWNPAGPPVKENKMVLSSYYPVAGAAATTARMYPLPPLPPLGALIESSLTNTQMQGLYPNSNFMLCDGRSCIGTYYWFIKGSPATLFVPDLRTGPFLRPARVESLIGTTGLQRTRVSGLTIAIGNNSHDMIVDHKANTNHYHTYDNGGNFANGALDNGGSSPPSLVEYNDSTFATSVAKMAATDSHTAAQHNFTLTSTETQTLPNFMIVNVFLRVN